MENSILWLSRHTLSPAQKQAIEDLHGDVEVVQEAPVFQSIEGLGERIRAHDGFVYAVASAAHFVSAALAGCEFGMFVNHPGRRADGTFGLHCVLHARPGRLERVWVNPDPESDQGELLVSAEMRPLL